MRIEAPHYVAGIVWEKKQETFGKYVMTDVTYTTITSCAPIVYWVKTKGFSFDAALSYFSRKGYAVTLHEF